MSKSNNFSMTRCRPGSYQVSGFLSVDTVRDYQSLGVKALKESREEDVTTVEFDMSDVKAKGSAVIALMIGWRREAEKVGADLKFTNCSEALLSIAEACGVRNILGCR